VKDIHKFSNLGFHLLDFEVGGGGVIVKDMVKSFLGTEVKEK